MYKYMHILLIYPGHSPSGLPTNIYRSKSKGRYGSILPEYEPWPPTASVQNKNNMKMRGQCSVMQYHIYDIYIMT